MAGLVVLGADLEVAGMMPAVLGALDRTRKPRSLELNGIAAL